MDGNKIDKRSKNFTCVTYLAKNYWLKIMLWKEGKKMIFKFPEIIQEKIDWYIWKNKIKEVNKEYFINRFIKIMYSMSKNW